MITSLELTRLEPAAVTEAPRRRNQAPMTTSPELTQLDLAAVAEARRSGTDGGFSLWEVAVVLAVAVAGALLLLLEENDFL